MAGIFLTIVQISSEFVGGQCASWRLPPKAAVSACRRHSFVEGIRNGGLDVTQNRRWSYGRVKGLLNDGFFSFAVVRQNISYLFSDTIWGKFHPPVVQSLVDFQSEALFIAEVFHR